MKNLLLFIFTILVLLSSSCKKDDNLIEEKFDTYPLDWVSEVSSTVVLDSIVISFHDKGGRQVAREIAYNAKSITMSMNRRDGYIQGMGYIANHNTTLGLKLKLAYDNRPHTELYWFYNQNNTSGAREWCQITYTF